MTSEIKIDKGVPVPSRGGGRRPKYPWARMEVGDSIFEPGVCQNTIAGIARGWRNRNAPDQMHRTKIVTENGVRGVRVWRIA